MTPVSSLFCLQDLSPFLSLDPGFLFASGCKSGFLYDPAVRRSFPGRILAIGKLNSTTQRVEGSTPSWSTWASSSEVEHLIGSEGSNPSSLWETISQVVKATDS